jgi:hypothetical protein
MSGELLPVARGGYALGSTAGEMRQTILRLYRKEREIWWKVVAAVSIVAAVFVLSTVLVYRSRAVRPIPYTIVEEGYALQVPENRQMYGSEPMLIVLTALQGMALPSDMSLSERLAGELEQIDWHKSFVVLAGRGGQLASSGTVKRILRRGNTVIVETLDVDVGPGNYVVPGWTQPYAVIAVEKTGGAWGRYVEFVLERETQGPVYDAYSYVP